MARLLYDLCGVDERLRFSPFCWRTHMALRHKALDYDAVPWYFTDKAAIAFSEQDKVPVMVDGDHVINDSYEIMRYLDRTYPGNVLIGSDEAQARARFIRHWSETLVTPAIFKIIILDIFSHLDPRDQDYFRESREARFGTTLENFHNSDQGHEMLNRALAPLRAQLQDSPFIDGETAGGADYIAFGVFMTAQVMRAEPIIAEDDVVNGWQSRLLDQFGGFARNAFTVHELTQS